MHHACTFGDDMVQNLDCTGTTQITYSCVFSVRIVSAQNIRKFHSVAT